MSGLSDEVREAARNAFAAGVWRDDRGVEVLNLSYAMQALAPLIHQAEARGAATERERLTASVQAVCDAYQRWDGKAENAGSCSAALSKLRAALTQDEQP